MNLTKEDLDAIRKLIHEETEPLRNTMKELLKAQIEIVDQIDELKDNAKLIMSHLNLSPRSRGLRKTLQDMD